MLMSKTSLGLLAVLTSTALLGYCFYFDRKRHSNPDFKKQLCERRRRRRQKSSSSDNQMEIDNGLEKYFMQEVEKGEMFISQGEFDRGTSHLKNAILVCHKPDKLLNLLQTTLPRQVFMMLIEKLNSQVSGQNEKSMDAFSPPGLMIDDALE